MKSAAGWFVLLLAAGAVRADDARHLARSGKYAEAAEVYSAKAGEDPQAALGLARCLEAQGKREAADAALARLAKPDAAIHAERARLAFARGQHAAARREADAALRLDPQQILAHWLSGELHRAAGGLEEAQAEYTWLVEHYNDHEVRQAESLRWIGLAAARHAEWNRLFEQFHFLVGDLYPDVLKIEPDFWPAHYEAGRLYLAKFNEAEAQREFEAALAINPNAAEVHAALAQVRLLARDVAGAQAAIDRALELNPQLVAAWQGRAELHWANFRPDQAAEVLLKKALPLDPTDEETLGRLAACYAILDGASRPRSAGILPAGEDAGETPALPSPALPSPGSRLAKLLEEVNSRNPHAGLFYLTLGQWLSQRHKIPEARQYLLEAAQRMPRMVGPRAELALLAMQAGREKEARGLFQEAFEADPFNLRVGNMLKLLDVLDKMETVETDRLVVRFDGRRDRLLARYLVPHVDKTYAELCERFGYQPPKKPLVEIFSEAAGAPGHAWFGTRMTGLPYVGTVAASSGMIAAMVSPNEPGAGPFPWARVLPHELVHVITLQQTQFNCPHWFTEALAVQAENTPRPWRWSLLLRRRLAADKLYTLDSINFGFTRPNSGDDWHLAYCQSKLYLDYMLDRHGPDRPRRLLAAYAEGLDTPAAIRRIFGVSQEEFEQGYLVYVRRIAQRASGLDRPAIERSFDELLAEHRRQPDDPDTAAELAAEYLRRGALAEAGELARQALAAGAHVPSAAKREASGADVPSAAKREEPRIARPLAGYVQARLLLHQEKQPEAIALLERCLDRNRPRPEVLSLLASLRQKAGESAVAEDLYELGHRLEPENPEWLRGLARLLLAAQDEARLAAALSKLAELTPEDVPLRKKLARLALDRKDYESAVRWAREGVEADVADGPLHGLFAEALAGRHNDAEAIQEYRTAIELAPDELTPRLGLAKVLIRTGQKKEAREVLDTLLERAQDDPEAKRLRESLQEYEAR